MPPPPFSPALHSFFCTNMRTARGLWPRWCLSVLVVLAVGGCRRNRQSGSQVPSLAVAYDMRPIDVASLVDNEAALQRALGMPAGEVAARLKAFFATGECQLTLVQDNKPLFQEKAQTQLTWDTDGNVRAAHKGSRHGFEVVAVGEKAYVRLDKGHVRGKGRRDVEVAEMVEIAYSGLRQALQQFGGVTVAAPRPERVGGREVITYNLGRTEEAAPLAANVLFPPGALPTVTPGAWRASTREAKLTGQVSIDVATGVVLQARLQGQLTCDGPDGQPMQLHLALRHSISEVGSPGSVREPGGAVSEFRRPLRPREPLAFFRDQLPAGSLAPTPPPR